jgi:hypothetical protein
MAELAVAPNMPDEPSRNDTKITIQAEMVATHLQRVNAATRSGQFW